MEECLEELMEVQRSSDRVDVRIVEVRDYDLVAEIV